MRAEVSPAACRRGGSSSRRQIRLEANAELEQGNDAPCRVDSHPPALRHDDPGEHAQQRRLASAVAADDAEPLSVCDGHGHIREGVMRLARLSVQP